MNIAKDLAVTFSTAAFHLPAPRRLMAPGHGVVVAGYADRIGSADANMTLSKLRAQVATDDPTAKSMSRGRVALRPEGSGGGDPSVESRRVAIGID